MSYDVYLAIDTGGPEPHAISDGHNYTYNCGPMFRRALGGGGINDLNGKSARELIGHLEAAVSHMRHPDNASEYRAMNPANGWGEHDSAAAFLEAILADCRRHPKATVRVT